MSRGNATVSGRGERRGGEKGDITSGKRVRLVCFPISVRNILMMCGVCKNKLQILGVKKFLNIDRGILWNKFVGAGVYDPGPFVDGGSGI